MAGSWERHRRGQASALRGAERARAPAHGAGRVEAGAGGAFPKGTPPWERGPPWGGWVTADTEPPGEEAGDHSPDLLLRGRKPSGGAGPQTQARAAGGSDSPPAGAGVTAAPSPARSPAPTAAGRRAWRERLRMLRGPGESPRRHGNQAGGGSGDSGGRKARAPGLREGRRGRRRGELGNPAPGTVCAGVSAGVSAGAREVSRWVCGARVWLV